LKFFRNIHVGVDCLYRALIHAGIAVNACFWIDVKAIGEFMEGVNGANGNATGEFTINTFFGDNITHNKINFVFFKKT
jgi:hypothetical protein